MPLWIDPEKDAVEPAPLTQLGVSGGMYGGRVLGEGWRTGPTSAFDRYMERRVLEEGIGAVIPTPLRGMASDLFSLELGKSKSRVMTKREANEKLKDMGITVDRDMPEEVVDLLAEERGKQLAADLVFRMATNDGEYGWGRRGLSFVADLAASIADPINLASSFVPVTRLGTGAMMAFKGAGVLEKAVAGARVVPLSTTVRRGVIEGAAGAAMVEPLLYVSLREENPDYGLGDSLTNILFGGVVGGGLHWFGGMMKGRARKAAEAPPGPRDRPLATTAEERARLEREAGGMLPKGEGTPGVTKATVHDNIELAGVGAAERIVLRVTDEVPQTQAARLDATNRDTVNTAHTVALGQVAQDRRPDVAPLIENDPTYPKPARMEGPGAPPLPRIVQVASIADTPTKADLPEGLAIVRSPLGEGGALYYELFKDGVSVGYAQTRDNRTQIGGVVVGKKFQRQGFGQMLYAAIERDLGVRLTPTENLTKPGKRLWKAYEKSPYRTMAPAEAPTPDQPAPRGATGDEAAPAAARGDADAADWAKRQQQPASDMHADFAAADAHRAAVKASPDLDAANDFAELMRTHGRILDEGDKGDILKIQKMFDDQATAVDVLAHCRLGGE